MPTGPASIGERESGSEGVTGEAQCTSVDRFDAESEIRVLRIGCVREIEAFERLMEIGVGVERLTRHELPAFPADGAATGRRVERA